MFYDTTLLIQYDDDEQYRDCLIKIFGRGADNCEIADTTEILSKIYDATLAEPRFAQLYSRAAAIIMSDDPANGLAILFSYSCLAKFHALLSIFFNETTLPLSDEADNLFNDLILILNHI